MSIETRLVSVASQGGTGERQDERGVPWTHVHTFLVEEVDVQRAEPPAGDPNRIHRSASANGDSRRGMERPPPPLRGTAVPCPSNPVTFHNAARLSEGTRLSL